MRKIFFVPLVVLLLVPDLSQATLAFSVHVCAGETSAEGILQTWDFSSTTSLVEQEGDFVKNLSCVNSGCSLDGSLPIPDGEKLIKSSIMSYPNDGLEKTICINKTQGFTNQGSRHKSIQADGSSTEVFNKNPVKCKTVGGGPIQ